MLGKYYDPTVALGCIALIVLLPFAFAGSSAQTAPPASSRPSSATKTIVPDAGQISKGFYNNSFFGFRYRMPYGWVDRTQDMNEDSTSAKSKALLGIFERPPEAAGSTINSAVVIAIESAAAYPGLKSAAQYFGPLGEITQANGLTPANEAYEFPVDGRPIVRRDFMKKMAGGAVMHQSTLARLDRGYVVSFTFIGGTDDEVQSLIEALAFGKTKTPAQK